MSSKKNRNRKSWSPQDDLEYEMRKSEESSNSQTEEPESSLCETSANLDIADSVESALPMSASDGGDQQELERMMAEFADLETALNERSSALDQRDEELTKRSLTLDKRDEELFDRATALDVREKEIVALQKSLGEKESFLETLENEIANEESNIKAREIAVRKAENDRDEGYRVARNEHEEQLQESEERSKSRIALLEQEAIARLQEELARIRTEHDAAIETETLAARESIAKERAAWQEERDRQIDELTFARKELDQRWGEVSALQSEIDRKSEDYDLTQQGFERQRARFNLRMEEERDSIDELVEERLRARREEFEAREQESANERARLLDQIVSQERLLSGFEDLKKQLGGKSLEEARAELIDLRDEAARVKEDIASGSAMQELSARIARAEGERDAANANLQLALDTQARQKQELLNFDRLQFELEEKTQELDYARQIADNASGEISRLNSELARYQAAYAKPKEREERIREIEKPFFNVSPEERPKKLEKNEIPDERVWLENIAEGCEEYGLHFNKRLLKAFHTSLKTAEWSPLTVLAGVSGTGKSELPRLYSYFGGIFFTSVAVQPNWDSKESMLGFFNSIDNKFDAEPVLRFLAQSQLAWRDETETEKGYPGLANAVCLTLLDEMNLAHPELYFAEFLSKFELRRGCDRDHLPAVDVKIGAGMDPHQIKLGRNMLWAGTMNQDETTKSLSDKVLDRSIVMYFPRPTKLKRRTSLKSLDDMPRNNGVLHIKTWNSWKVDETESVFSYEEIKSYKKFVEEINDALGEVGRALGHRVWQSVEYYMASYPDVRLSEQGSKERADAMHIAFEDQIVQKIMPKLRGIDTAGTSDSKCLTPIKELLGRGVEGIERPFSLDADFELARDLGYGQFVWQSANYLKEEDDIEE